MLVQCEDGLAVERVHTFSVGQTILPFESIEHTLRGTGRRGHAWRSRARREGQSRWECSVQVAVVEVVCATLGVARIHHVGFAWSEKLLALNACGRGDSRDGEPSVPGRRRGSGIFEVANAACGNARRAGEQEQLNRERGEGRTMQGANSAGACRQLLPVRIEGDGKAEQ